MDTKTLGKWIYLIGLLTAVVVALIEFSADWLTLLLMIAGILTGLWYSDPEDIENIIIRYVGLAAVAATLDSFVVIGPSITTIMQAVVRFLGPAILAALVLWFYNKTTAK